MAQKNLDDRRKALEDAFFQKQNEKLLDDLRTKKERDKQRAALAENMHFHDEEILDQLLDVGIRAESWLAISVVPLVEVAWADREVAKEERAAILRAAREHGIEKGSPTLELLDTWLEVRPAPMLREAWAGYVKTVTQALSRSTKEALRDEILDRSRVVAAAAGSFLGLGGRVSEEEESVLEDLRKAF